MSSTVFDSALFRDMFGTSRMRTVFSDDTYLETLTRVEVALARAQARVGVIPRSAADAIARACDPQRLDRERLRRETDNVGYPVLPLVSQLSEQCGDDGGYLHWGATTQDIMDTATMVQCAHGLSLIGAALDELRERLRRLAATHIDTVTAGRTHLQHALPITFGYRAAVWLSALDRHAERLAEVRRRDLMVQFGGAAGTLASLGPGPEALRVRAELAAELGLRNPEITWHVARDGLTSIVGLLAAIGASVGKIGTDIALMCSTEIAEAAEPYAPGRGASSTMPQKRNPISSELMIAAARLLRDKSSAMLDAALPDFERATGPWHIEWAVVPEAFLLLSSSLAQATHAVSGLRIDTGRMRSNVDLTGGLILAEAVMMALAPRLGRQRAHHVVYAICVRAAENSTPLADALSENRDIVAHLGEQRIRQLCDPAAYLGSARAMTRSVIAPSGRPGPANTAEPAQ
ncbi:adenylosuccinate lyase family protein [Streptomyces hygroscopicus]|uniref:class-II fumarase/aspartase family protein n=1 Tax=Streptomyces hygroscopicus TaxID=1912 RepID=UPI00076742C8|nr:adenylosuccinate lyase family protein [Streptomyces hygroscopicus]GLV78153.1 3-carboxy-cis,cis-muconate cycloisomerase [Streptomyces hygroscopicus subsp. hygroscopicus]